MIALCDRKLSVRTNTDIVLVVKTTMQVYHTFTYLVTYLVSILISFVRINREKRERKIVVAL